MFLPAFRSNFCMCIASRYTSFVFPFFAILTVVATSQAEDAARLEHFEKHIRPLLVERCLECHGEDSQEGGLRMDSRDAMLLGGDSGAAMIPGNPEESLLVRAISYTDPDLQMPPDEKLDAGVVEAVRRWISEGATDPRQSDGPLAEKESIDIEAGREHWAYQPIREPSVPQVEDTSWPRTDIDRFILARLESEGLEPTTDADRETLARRAFFALNGLPPTPAQIDEFVEDHSPDAFERLVDRLLASPRFGEHWGRHWLDVARFAESTTLRGFVFPQAWRYRDYVIDAYNQDLPFEQFLREQISGDLMQARDDRDRARKLIATTFLTIGPTNLEEQNKEMLNMNAVDEQLDTIGKAILGQTIGCARCHDHKFDAIPTTDYYALAGIFRSTSFMEHDNVSKWIEVPLPLTPEEEAVQQAYESQVTVLEDRIAELRRIAGTLIEDRTGPLDAASLPGIVVDDRQAEKVGEWTNSKHKNTYIGKGYLHDGNAGKGKKSLSFQVDLDEAGRYEVFLAYLAGTNRSSRTPITILTADGEIQRTIDQRKLAPIDGRFLSLGSYSFETNGFSTVIVSNENADGHVVADAVIFLPVDESNTVHPSKNSGEEASQTHEELAALDAKFKKLQANAPPIPKAMTVRDRDEPSDVRVHVRGLVSNLGEPVKRGFLQVATYRDVKEIPRNESGRLQLGEWIGSVDNPLTARVYVNRVWHWLHGYGLVRSVDNFGTTGDQPSHPRLLDYLARRFLDEGWSTKRLVREIVLSRTWGLSCKANEATVAADPMNRLLARAHRQRLQAEMFRDTILYVSGKLDLSMGGTTIPPNVKADYGYRHASVRRSIYVPQFRNVPLEMLEVFDMANSSFTSGQRANSTVAPQALYLMNHPFVMEQAKVAARRAMAETPTKLAKLNLAWRRTLGRDPTPGETRLMLDHLSGADEESESQAWSQIYQALFSSLDFRYIE